MPELSKEYFDKLALGGPPPPYVYVSPTDKALWRLAGDATWLLGQAKTNSGQRYRMAEDIMVALAEIGRLRAELENSTIPTASR